CLRGRPRRRGLLALLLHEPGAVRLLGRVLVVAGAAEPEVVHGGLAATGELLHMVELEIATGSSAPARFTRVRALTAVSLPHRAPHVVGDVARARLGVAPALAWPGARPEANALELLDQQLDRAVVDLGKITALHLVAEQVLRVAEALVGFAAARELDGVGLGGQRSDAVTRARRWRARARNLLRIRVAKVPRGTLRARRRHQRRDIEPP